MPNVLLVDDEATFLEVLRKALRARGYDVQTAATAEQALSAVVLKRPDLLVLDLSLPDLDGVDVIRRLRTWTEIPIVVLSADGTELRKIHALDAGADDFLTKPFGLGELEARLRVALRHRSDPAAAMPEEPLLAVGPLQIDLGRRQVRLRDEPVELTAKEFDLLAFLARHAGKVLTHRMVLERVWGPERADDTHSLRVYANRLRAKLEDDPTHPVLLRTSPGVGYQLVAPDGA